MFNDIVLIFLSFYVIILKSNAKVIYFLDIRKQFITFLIENLTNYYFFAFSLPNFVRNEQFLAFFSPIECARMVNSHYLLPVAVAKVRFHHPRHSS